MNDQIKRWNEWYANQNCGANLNAANLSGAKNIIRLPVGDPRGYDCVAFLSDSGWRIYVGCRYFFMEEAKKHWGENYKGEREIGDRYIYALNWLETQTKGEG
jgi:hypothetical protein